MHKKLLDKKVAFVFYVNLNFNTIHCENTSYLSKEKIDYELFKYQLIFV